MIKSIKCLQRHEIEANDTRRKLRPLVQDGQFDFTSLKLHKRITMNDGSEGQGTQCGIKLDKDKNQASGS